MDEAGGSVLESTTGFADAQQQLSFSSQADSSVAALFQLLVKLMIGKGGCRHIDKHAEGARENAAC
jgi:hypothetical protein